MSSKAKSTSKSVMRSVKNLAYGYTSIEIKVREATCNDESLPSNTLLRQISSATNSPGALQSIVKILDKRLNDNGKNWRHIYKALIVLDYLLHDGSDQVTRYLQDNLHCVKTLQQFQYIDSDGIDRGANVRSMARSIVSLFEHPDTLSSQRTDRDYWMNRFTSDGAHGRALAGGKSDNSGPSRSSTNLNDRAFSNTSVASYSGREDTDLKRAIEESKRTAELETQIRAHSEEEIKLALELSFYEEENRKTSHQRASITEGMTRNVTNTNNDNPMKDLLDLFEGPPAPMPVSYHTSSPLMLTNNPMPTESYGLPQLTYYPAQNTYDQYSNSSASSSATPSLGPQIGSQQLFGNTSGLDSVKLNPTFAQGSYGTIQDRNMNQGNMYSRPSALRNQESQMNRDPFSDLTAMASTIPALNNNQLALVPGALAPVPTNNPYSKSLEDFSSQLAGFDPLHVAAPLEQSIFNDDSQKRMTMPLPQAPIMNPSGHGPVPMNMGPYNGMNMRPSFPGAMAPPLSSSLPQASFYPPAAQYGGYPDPNQGGFPPRPFP